MRRIVLGPELVLDLDRLITTRLLLQANSGGGKSWALRRMIEQCHGHVQQLVVDPEGEFATLRERYDFVLAARTGGDTVADPRTAAELATRFLEWEASAILDLYELKPPERKAFVHLFLAAVVEAPRRLWHPVLVYLDEAHVYCPEKDEAESAEAVIDLATRGRKRGYCLVAATQRLAKFDKDAAAELKNKMVGNTVLDDDMKRAGDELGFRTQEQRLGLRALEEGTFFAFGPAFGNAAGVVRGRTGPVLTTHPKAGAQLRRPTPPPTAKIKALLPKLADLPKEAAERAATMDSLRRDLIATRRDLAAAKRAQPAAPVVPRERVVRAVVRVPFLRKLDRRALDALAANVAAELGAKLGAAWSAHLDGLIERELHGTPLPGGPARGIMAAAGPAPAAGVGGRPQPPTRPTGAPAHAPPSPPAPRQGAGEALALPRLGTGARRMLEALARRHPIPTTWAQVAQLAGLATSGGTFTGYCRALAAHALVNQDGGRPQLTDAGWAHIGQVPGAFQPTTTRELLEVYRRALSKASYRMAEFLADAHPSSVSRDSLANALSMANSGGTFSGYVRDLIRAGLAVDEGGGMLRASDLLMHPATVEAP